MVWLFYYCTLPLYLDYISGGILDAVLSFVVTPPTRSQELVTFTDVSFLYLCGVIVPTCDKCASHGCS